MDESHSFLILAHDDEEVLRHLTGRISPLVASTFMLMQRLTGLNGGVTISLVSSCRRASPRTGETVRW